jgi:retron-type reverse transcriptase
MLHGAYLKARKGKRYTPGVLRFSARLEERLLGLREELRARRYRISPYHRFDVYEPKKREVASLPFREQVVQHALIAVIEPIFDKRFIYDSYACRVGKGTHAGADRITDWLRRTHRMWPQTYVLKADVKSYFASVDHGILKALLRRRIRCDGTLWLMDLFVDSWNPETGKGIPIGNLTSQLYANVYLHELDRFVKHDLRQRFYLRYMDDFVIIGPDKTELNVLRSRIDRFLQEHLRLRLNSRTSVFPEKQGVDFLGYRIWRTHRLLRKRSVKRMRRRIRAWRNGRVGDEEMEASVAAWLGHAEHADTYNLQRELLGGTGLI